MSANLILNPSDALNLQNQGLLGPRTIQGTRRLHKRRLNIYSENEHWHIPLDPSLQSEEAFSEIPEYLISRATLIYLGFSQQSTSAIWNQWTNWPASGPGREVDRPTDTWMDNDPDWLTCLTASGLANDTQLAIMDPVFKHIRLTQSCLHWVKDTIRMRFDGLKDIQRASMLRDSGLINLVSAPGSSGHGIHSRNASNSGNSSQGGQASSFGSGHSSRPSLGHHRNRSMSELQRIATPGVAPETSRSASAIAARNAPGHTVLFKGIDQARITGLFNNRGQIDRIEKLRSSAPSDFAGHDELYYFTPDYKVAEYYAAYAKRRDFTSAICVVSIAIPNSAIEQMGFPDILRIYWPNPEWKELIWNCRQGRIFPRNLRKYKLATLVIGTIASRPNAVFQRMDSPSTVTSDCVLRVDSFNPNSSAAVQYVFSAEEGEYFLREHVGDNIRVTPFVRSDLEEWVNDFRSLLG